MQLIGFNQHDFKPFVLFRTYLEKLPLKASLISNKK